MSGAGPHSLEFRSATGELLMTIAVVENGSSPPRKGEQRTATRDPDKDPQVPTGRQTGGDGKVVQLPGTQQHNNSPSVHTHPALQPGNGLQVTEDKMTDAQKRFLFRILAAKGITGDKAYDHLKEFFQTDTLKDISKLDASRGIERLLEEAKGGSNHGH